MTQEALIKKIYSNIKNIAYSKASNNQIAKDFLQEGLLAALEVVRKYEDKSDEELLKIMYISARNKINTILVKEINWYRRNYATTKREIKEDNWFIEEHYNPEDMGKFDIKYDEILEKNFIRSLEFYLDIRDKKILKEKLRPSKKTIKIFENELKNNEKKKGNGKLVMYINNPKIRNVHIAKSLNLSKSTINRGIKNIQKVIVFLNGNL